MESVKREAAKGGLENLATEAVVNANKVREARSDAATNLKQARAKLGLLPGQKDDTNAVKPRILTNFILQDVNLSKDQLWPRRLLENQATATTLKIEARTHESMTELYIKSCLNIL